MLKFTHEEIYQLQFNARSQIQNLEPCSLCVNNSNVEPPNLTVLGEINSGSFGKVQLVQNKATEDFLALKIIKKRDAVRVDHLVNERRFLASLKFPFIVKYAGHFQTKENLYLMMEYVDGCQLYNILTSIKRLTDNQCRFYLSEVLLCLEYFHSLGIVYRDLKLENLMLDREGHIKLVDLGFTKKMTISKTICGTPEYLAPEILNGLPYDKGVDWWAFGILAYELMSGSNLFPENSQYDDKKRSDEVLMKITQGLRLEYPDDVTIEFRDLVKKLLELNPIKRLGNCRGKKVRHHDWFHGIDFEEILQKCVKPPLNFDDFPKKALREIYDPCYDLKVNIGCDDNDKYKDF